MKKGSSLSIVYAYYSLPDYRGQCVAVRNRLPRPLRDKEVEEAIAFGFSKVDELKVNVVEICVVRESLT